MLFDSLSFQMFPESTYAKDIGGSGSSSAAAGGGGRNAGLLAELLNAETRSSFLNWTFSNGRDIHGGKFASYRFLESKKNGTLDFNNVRIYGCYQSLMKLHPLFDVALIKVCRMLGYQLESPCK